MHNTLTDEQAWFILYQALVAMDNHPRNEHPQSAKDLALSADKFLNEFRRRYPCQP